MSRVVLSRVMDLETTPNFRAAYPDGSFGALVVRNCSNRPNVEALAWELRMVEEGLRARFPCDSIDSHPVARAYAGYFKRFGGRYPVVHQAKSVLAGKPIESGSALVTAMFAAELDSLVLTSGHDLGALAWPLRVDVASDGDSYTKISGKAQVLRLGDMVVRDREGVIASVLFGPDHRTRMRQETDAVLFGAWSPSAAPPHTVGGHLEMLARLIRIEWPGAEIEPPLIVTASS
jgi:DNA/RNA-binding domain of Phe-tRNA-synthetase-like protein